LGSQPTAELPFVDEHRIEVPASREEAWDAVCEVVGAAFRGRASSAFARVVGVREAVPRGEPGTPGSAVVGFRVARAIEPSELVLEGEHRFSRYALVFRFDALPGGTSTVRAETRAAFPGLRGRAYRALVIGTRAHVLAVRRLLHAVRARATKTA
jgi:hypothetical protein